MIMVAILAVFAVVLPLPAQEIDTLALESHVSLLADDLLEGRAPGTRGERLGALYLISQLRRLGLEPLTDRGYLLPVPLTAVEVDLEHAVVRLSGDGQERTLRPPAFYHPGGSRSAFRGFSGDLVFAGPGANAMEALTGYEGLGGKVVVLTPPWTDIEKVETELLNRGAVGTVQLVPNEIFYDRLRIVRGPTRFFLPDGVDDPANQGHLPGVVGGGAMIRALGIDDYITGGDLGGPVALNRRFELEMPFTTEERTGYNVAGVIRGTDPGLRDEWITYVAHYDHVGQGEPAAGDSIWNGFIDNAAGCAMLLEIARVMAADPPPRSVAFLFVTAEEQGLLGSNWFVHDPPVPLHRIRAVLNLDGGAPPAPPVAWGLVGADESWAGGVARATIEGQGWSVRGVAPGPQSDHWPFYLAGVPALLLFPGDTLESVTEREAADLRERWQREHTPDDEWSPDFPLTGMARYAELALRIGRELATVNVPPLPVEYPETSLQLGRNIPTPHLPSKRVFQWQFTCRGKCIPGETMRRRTFVGQLAAGLAFSKVPAAIAAPVVAPAARPLRVPVLGGTTYVGPSMIREVRASGHAVTMFNRGYHRPHAFPSVERLVGNRFPERGLGLGALEGSGVSVPVGR